MEPGDRSINLRILTFNIHNGINWYGRYDLKGIIDFIIETQPDLIGLQEVSRFWSPQTQYQDLVRILEKDLKIFSAYSAALQRGHHSSFGNLILSKHPIVSYWSEVLPGRLERRSFIAVQVGVEGTRVNYLTAHLGLSVADRLEQIQRIIQFANNFNSLIISGDFNGELDDPPVVMLRKRWRKAESNELKNSGTFRLQNRVIGPEIDMIFTTSNYHLKRFQVIDCFLSDHLPVIADFSFNLPWPLTAGQPVYV